MNLTKLFETQAKLDEHIMQEHPELRGQNNLDWKLLALQVELGECANEWRGFKKWSKDQEPRTKVPVTAWGEPYKNPLLEEYVDCLHFILSIGLELGYDYESNYMEKWKSNDDILVQFNSVFWCVSELINRTEPQKEHITEWDYFYMFGYFIGLGEMLGFTWDEVEEAYYAKNKVNHARQESGY